MNRIEFDSIWWKHIHTNLAPIGKPRIVLCQSFLPIGITQTCRDSDATIIDVLNYPLCLQ